MLLNSMSELFSVFQPGRALQDGGALAQLVGVLFSTEDDITAAAGGGQDDARRLTASSNRVKTVETSEDSVMLPLAIPGRTVTIENATATTLGVFGDPANPNTGAGDTIAAAASATQEATATGVTQPATALGVYVCVKAGEWKQGLLVT